MRTHRTVNDLTANAKKTAIELLNVRLAEGIDLAAADEAGALEPRWRINTRVLAVIPAGQGHMERAKAGLAILMAER